MTTEAEPREGGVPSAATRAGGALGIAAIASGAAGLIHAVAVGIHAETAALARIFVVLAVLQCSAGALALTRRSRIVALAVGGLNLAAFAGWVITRFVGISWINGLEVSESAQLADTVAAAFAAVAVIAAAVSLRPNSKPSLRFPLAIPAVVAAALVFPAMETASTHQHDHGDDHETADHAEEHGDDHGIATVADDHDAADHDAADHDDGHDHDAVAVAWPRPWDPTGPIDFSGVVGVTTEQQDRAENLVALTLTELPRFADVTTLAALGYRSIGDEGTGFEHFINNQLINDDRFLDPTAPESLVYQVDGESRTLVSAMFIARQTPVDDPELVAYGGPLMEWHVHDNLCWGLGDDGTPRVVAVTDAEGNCPARSVKAGGENPMVHVWISPHECGPFAALEGHGAGQAAGADGERADQCAHDDASRDDSGHDGHEVAVVPPTPYDPTMPIDLSGVEGVSLEQQAFAENLVAETVRDLPKWADLDVVEAAGFHSIGDGLTGHEHYIQWDWIDDDVVLDPDFPESLVFERQPDGSKKLVSAMFMLPSSVPLDDAPDWGGKLMQWHIHGDLCFTNDPVAPQVAGLKPIGADCRSPLVNGTLAPMVHVWITPHECGPFAALDGIGAGQVAADEDEWCDTAHGAH